MQKLDLKNSIGTLIALTSKSMERAAEYGIRKELGLTPSQWKIILALDLFQGLSQKELADKIYMDTSTLVPIIDKMEEAGLIERRSDPKDRRQNRLHLTKKSEATTSSITKIILQLRKEMYQGIAKTDLEFIRPILQKIISNADKISNKKRR